MVLISVLCLVAGGAAQDVIFLKDGQKFKGKILAETPDHLELKTAFGQILFKRSSIQEIFKLGALAEENPAMPRNSIMDLTGTTRKLEKKSRVRDKKEKNKATPPVEKKKQNLGAKKGKPKTLVSPRIYPPEREASPRSRAQPFLSVENLEALFLNLKKRLGPFFPRETSPQIAVIFLLFLVSLGLVQVGCRFMDIDSFNLSRGIFFNLVLVVAIGGLYLLRDFLVGPLQVVLALLLALMVITTSAGALFNVRAGRSTVLVGFVLFTGGICLTCITVGVLGVVNLS